MSDSWLVRVISSNTKEFTQGEVQVWSQETTAAEVAHPLIYYLIVYTQNNIYWYHISVG